MGVSPSDYTHAVQSDTVLEENYNLIAESVGPLGRCMIPNMRSSQGGLATRTKLGASSIKRHAPTCHTYPAKKRSSTPRMAHGLRWVLNACGISTDSMQSVTNEVDEIALNTWSYELGNFQGHAGNTDTQFEAPIFFLFNCSIDALAQDHDMGSLQWA